MQRKSRYGAPVLSALRNREASVSQRLTMYYNGSDFNPCHGLCPLYGGCPPLGGSVMGGSIVLASQKLAELERVTYPLLYQTARKDG